jgi:hypothetical protein
MHKCYYLPRPTFRDWLFGIAPTICVRAEDNDGNLSTIRLEYRGKEFGRIEVRFDDDGASAPKEV